MHSKKAYGSWIIMEILFWEARHLSGRVKITLGACILRVTRQNGGHCKNLVSSTVRVQVRVTPFLLVPFIFLSVRKQAFEAALLAQTWKIKYEDIKWPANKGKLGSRKSMVSWKKCYICIIHLRHHFDQKKMFLFWMAKFYYIYNNNTLTLTTFSIGLSHCRYHWLIKQQVEWPFACL